MEIITQFFAACMLVLIVTYNILYCLFLTGTLLVAPMDLTVEIISYQMLVVSWNYPSSLLAQTMFKVTTG